MSAGSDGFFTSSLNTHVLNSVGCVETRKARQQVKATDGRAAVAVARDRARQLCAQQLRCEGYTLLNVYLYK